MRVLLDECVNPRLRRAFPHHRVFTIHELNWQSLADRELIAGIDGAIDVLVTIDKGFEHQHNLRKLSFGIVIVHLAQNTFASYEALFADILAAAVAVRPGQVIHVASKRKRASPK